MKFLTDLAARIAATKPTDPATLDEAAPGERDTGVKLDDDLLRFYGLLGALKTGLQKRIKKHSGDGKEGHKHNKAKCKAFVTEAVRSLNEYNDLTNVFWAAAQAAASYPEENSIGVRKGGVIVVFNKEPKTRRLVAAVQIPHGDDVSHLFERLFGLEPEGERPTP